MTGERITPDSIGQDLPRDVIFVYGSNELGIHGSGAARLAFNHFGAKMNHGFGISGQSFGIPTKDWEIQTLPLETIRFYVERFNDFVTRHLYSKWNFYVTRIGCGLAGYTPKDIAPMFAPLRHVKNVWLPQDFIDIIDGKTEVDEKQNVTTTLP